MPLKGPAGARRKAALVEAARADLTLTVLSTALDGMVSLKTKAEYDWLLYILAPTPYENHNLRA